MCFLSAEKAAFMGGLSRFESYKRVLSQFKSQKTSIYWNLNVIIMALLAMIFTYAMNAEAIFANVI